jgi:hypothetical protein
LEPYSNNKVLQEEMIDTAMTNLAKAGYVVQLEESKRGVITWAVDPRLATLYRDHRLNIIKAKQRQADERVRIVRSLGHEIERHFVRGYDPSTMD